MHRTLTARIRNQTLGRQLRVSTGQFLEEIVSTFFPKTCPLCRGRLREPGLGFCAPCSSSFLLIRAPFCDQCGAPLGGTPGKLCGLCANCLCTPSSPGTPRPRVRSAALHAGPLRDAVLGAKYAGRTAMAASLGIFLQSRYRDMFGAEPFDRILPVPLHVRRLRQRGFNQCDFLARPLAKELGVPLDHDSVARIRNTPPQSGAGRGQRRRNLRGAFSAVHPRRVEGRSFLILDDVYTTGATVHALYEVLRSAGAGKVAAFTLTRTMDEATAAAAAQRNNGAMSPSQDTP
jgi:ComF family protein